MEQTITEIYHVEFKIVATVKQPCHKCGGKILVKYTRREKDGTYRVFTCNQCDMRFTRFHHDESYES